ncbi:hypothetical protein [Streptomyces sp. CBMA123]|nr:hypothetical protein [Streptomyces sp. CBMA123]
MKLRAAAHDGADADYVLGFYQALAWLCRAPRPAARSRNCLR